MFDVRVSPVWLRLRASSFHTNTQPLLQPTYLCTELFPRESVALQHLAFSKLNIVLPGKRKGYPIKSNRYAVRSDQINK